MAAGSGEGGGGQPPAGGAAVAEVLVPLGDDVEGVVHVVVEELLARLQPPPREDADAVVAARQHDARQAVGRLGGRAGRGGGGRGEGRGWARRKGGVGGGGIMRRQDRGRKRTPSGRVPGCPPPAGRGMSMARARLGQQGGVCVCGLSAEYGSREVCLCVD